MRAFCVQQWTKAATCELRNDWATRYTVYRLEATSAYYHSHLSARKAFSSELLTICIAPHPEYSTLLFCPHKSRRKVRYVSIDRQLHFMDIVTVIHVLRHAAEAFE